jgi:hypothetical protein
MRLQTDAHTSVVKCSLNSAYFHGVSPVFTSWIRDVDIVPGMFFAGLVVPVETADVDSALGEKFSRVIVNPEYLVSEELS